MSPHPIRTFVAIAVLTALAAYAALGGCAHGTRVEHAWVRASGVGATTAAYFELVNGGPDTLHLTGVGGDVAEAIQMHSTVRENGMVTMRESGEFDVPPGARLPFKPGGHHVMLQKLRVAIAEGNQVNLVLHFRGAPDLPIVAEVRR